MQDTHQKRIYSAVKYFPEIIHIIITGCRGIVDDLRTGETSTPWYDFPVYYEGDGKTAQFLLRESDECYKIYTINFVDATATADASIVASNVSSISKLTY